MHDSPPSEALLDIVAELLRSKIIPALDGATAYHARVAANVLDIVAREWRSGPSDDAAEVARLCALLDCDEIDVVEMNHMLAARIRNGALTLDQPEVAGHLWATTLAKVAVDQPKFARFRMLAQPEKGLIVR